MLLPVVVGSSQLVLNLQSRSERRQSQQRERQEERKACAHLSPTRQRH